MRTESAQQEPAPFSLFAPALAALALHLACASRYGFFRDELYFVSCGKRLAWGYVDQPPLVAAFARACWELAGGSVLLFRLPSALCHAATVYLVSRLAARLGGGRAAVLLAGLCVATAPVFLAFGGLVTMNVIEPLLWIGVVSLLVNIGQGGSERLWLGAGALIGLGVLNKHSMIFLAAGLLLGLLVTPQRRLLISRWALAGALVAVAIVLPHALWQIRAGFPMLELLAAQKWKNAPFSLGTFFFQQALTLNPISLAVWLPGLVFLWRAPKLRPVAVGFVLVEILLAALKGKSYYAASLYPPLFAAGGVAVEHALRSAPPLRGALAGAVALVGLLLAPLAVPLLDESTLVSWMKTIHQHPEHLENTRYGVLPQVFADQHGWQAMVDAVAKAQEKLTPDERAHARTFTQNYGEASALELLGQGRVPPPISGHNSWWVWGPGPEPITATLIVGGRASDHSRSCGELTIGARVEANPWVMPYEDELPIFVCRKLKVNVNEIWPREKHYN